MDGRTGGTGTVVCHVTSFFFLPYFDMADDETSTHSHGKGLIGWIRGFVVAFDEDETRIGAIMGGSSL
jgi:hypothetical protein